MKKEIEKQIEEDYEVTEKLNELSVELMKLTVKIIKEVNENK